VLDAGERPGERRAAGRPSRLLGGVRPDQARDAQWEVNTRVTPNAEFGTRPGHWNRSNLVYVT